MEDSRIVSLYWQRKEEAIDRTEEKYGRYLTTIAYNILSDLEDSKESVNDTYLAAWDSIPPQKPQVLSTYLGKLTRRISLNKWRRTTTKKRGGGEMPLALEELSECIPSGESVEGYIEGKELARTLNTFVGSLPDTERDVFISRYWFLASVKEISEKFGFSESKVKSMLLRTREKLRKILAQEGYL